MKLKLFVFAAPNAGDLWVGSLCRLLAGLAPGSLLVPMHLPGTRISESLEKSFKEFPEGIYVTSKIAAADLTSSLVADKSCKFVAVQRDFKDAFVASLLTSRMSPSAPQCIVDFQKKFDFLDDASWCNAFIEANLEFMVDSLRLHLAHEKKLWASNSFNIDYRKLFTNFDEVVKKLAGLLGIPLVASKLSELREIVGPESHYTTGRLSKPGLGETILDEFVKARITFERKKLTQF